MLANVTSISRFMANVTSGEYARDPIPIFGDASSFDVLPFEVPLTRELYDSFTRHFVSKRLALHERAGRQIDNQVSPQRVVDPDPDHLVPALTVMKNGVIQTPPTPNLPANSRVIRAAASAYPRSRRQYGSGNTASLRICM